jgi:hypothetical protein
MSEAQVALREGRTVRSSVVSVTCARASIISQPRRGVESRHGKALNGDMRKGAFLGVVLGLLPDAGGALKKLFGN